MVEFLTLFSKTLLCDSLLFRRRCERRLRRRRMRQLFRIQLSKNGAGHRPLDSLSYTAEIAETSRFRKKFHTPDTPPTPFAGPASLEPRSGASVRQPVVGAGMTADLALRDHAS